MKRNLLKIFILVCFTVSALSLGSAVKVNAAFPAGCTSPNGIPESCPIACLNSQDSGCYVPDLQCINTKFINPAASCCNNKCNGTTPPPPEGSDVLLKLNIFGTQFVFTRESIPSLINAVISTFLGIVSFYALGRGAYLGAFIRTNATSADDIAKVNKEVINLLIGFVLAWSFIFIIQFIASVLGIGSLNDFNVSNTGSEIIIK